MTKKENHLFYNKRLSSLANTNRHTMTKAEACLWKYVLKAKMTGYTFNRQRPVLNYIADFMCKEFKLIIEVDGITHTFEDVIKHDTKRQNELENYGFTVLRFTDNEVLTGIENVRRCIFQTLEKLDKSLPQPPPEGDKLSAKEC